jgi:hypothetical protein
MQQPRRELRFGNRRVFFTDAILFAYWEADTLKTPEYLTIHVEGNASYDCTTEALPEAWKLLRESDDFVQVSADMVILKRRIIGRMEDDECLILYVTYQRSYVAVEPDYIDRVLEALGARPPADEGMADQPGI